MEYLSWLGGLLLAGIVIAAVSGFFYLLSQIVSLFDIWKNR